MDDNMSGSAEEQFEQESAPVFRMRALFPKQFDYTLYFYEGSLPVVSNLIEVPADKRHWAQRAYTLGFRLDMNGDPINYAEMLAWFDNPVAADDESAESAEETADEGADGGRQPATDDGVRPSAEPGDDSVPAEGLDGGSGDGPAARAEGVVTTADLDVLLPGKGRQPRSPKGRGGR